MSDSFNREVLKVSHGFTGRGIATYPNGDVYDGTFVDGVFFKFITSILYRSERVKIAHTSISQSQMKMELLQKASTRDNGHKI